jgi:ankyrin repeat protein
LFNHGADINAKDNSGKTSLHWASQESKTDFCRFLVGNDALLNELDRDNKTPLDLVTEKEQYLNECLHKEEFLEHLDKNEKAAQECQ